MSFVLRWAKRLGVAFLALIAVLTVAAFVYDAASDGGVPARKLYAGPYVRVDGRLLAYRRWGTHGTPVVLIGGFVEPSDVWRMVGPLLGRTHRVYALDLPPFGYSERKGPYTLAEWLDEIEGFERALGIVRPTLVGHSLGAADVVGEALRHPKALRGIVLEDGDAIRSGGAPSWVPDLVIDPYYTALYRIVTGSDWIFRKALKSAYGPDAPALTATELDRWQRPFRVAGTAAAFKQMLPHGIAGWTLADLRRVRGVPVVVVWGEKDTVDSVAAGRESAKALRAPFVVLPRAGHLSMLVDPAGLAAAVERVAGS
ncbi:MAG TPA: alpha/beta hydrolase [Gaiellaceae bacterium]|nr:alpha/beta hydrolase [Gaiellaceae bacterium]